MSKHTPSPWIVKFRNDGSSYISMGDPLVGPHKQADLFLTSDGDESSIADARLISAAPELLEALEAMRAAAEMEDWDGRSSAYALAEKAIAKATGE